MRFFTLFSTCSLLVGALAAQVPSITRTFHLDKRQLPIGPASLTVCATVDADVDISAALPLDLLTAAQRALLGLTLVDLGRDTDVNLTQDLCLCVAGGILTPDTLARLRVDLKSQTGVIAQLLQVASIDAVLNPIVQALLVILGQRAADDTCPAYPANAQPICGSCDYTCAEGTVRCGDRCLAAGTPCPSGISFRRKRTVNPDLMCPKGLTACSATFKVQGAFGRVECLDTRRSIETCGGCEFPLPGRKKGEDCSAIEGSEEVSCIKGRCVVQACQEGFALVDGQRCEPVKA